MSKIFKRVLVAEVHYSHRIVEVLPGMTDADILAAAENAAEVFCEYSHTLQSDQHTIEEASEEDVAAAELND